MKHLLLDIGNVLVNQDMEPFIKALSKQMNLSKEDSYHFLNRIQKKQDLGITSITDEIVTHFSIKSEYIVQDLIDAWRQTVVPNHTSLQFMSTMKSIYKLDVAIVSNLGFEHMNHFKNTLKQYSVFTDSVHHFSCEVGARKPTPLYYHMLLELHPQFKGAVYVDDLEENLKTGTDMGFHSFKLDLSEYTIGDGFALDRRLKELHEILANS